MTRKSYRRRMRERVRLPQLKNIAGIHFDLKNNKSFIVTNDILTKQIGREGPMIAKSFDILTQIEMEECSKILGRVNTILMRHLPDVEDNGSYATIARLLLRSQNGLLAAVEVARHGFPHEVGILARSHIELLATAISIAINPDVLEQFHNGTLVSTKCITWANKAIPIFGRLNRILSNDFVHITNLHSQILLPKSYEQGEETLRFVCNTLMILFWFLDIVTELAYAEELDQLRHWVREGEGFKYQPSDEMREWADRMIFTS